MCLLSHNILRSYSSSLKHGELVRRRLLPSSQYFRNGTLNNAKAAHSYTTNYHVIPMKQQFTFRCFSSSIDKLGLGGNNWSRMDPAKYQAVVAASLEQGFPVLEAGQEGGDQALMEAYKLALPNLPKSNQAVTMTLRLGYRTILPVSQQSQTTQPQGRFPGDIEVEQHPFLGPNRTNDPIDEEDAALKAQLDSSAKSSSSEEGDDNMIKILHNIHDNYLHHQLKASPLVQEYQQQQQQSDNGSNSNLKIVALLHNPEAQIMSLAKEQDIHSVSQEERQAFLRDRLIQAFMAMEKAIEKGYIASYGVTSNGLGLPSDHPLALSMDTIVEAAKMVMERLDLPAEKCNLSVIQLPINLMERTGLEVARAFHANEAYRFLKHVELYAMRPLTCYPDRGTGTGHAFRLLDYLLPSGPKQDKQVKNDDSSNEKDGGDNNSDGIAQELDKNEISDEDITSKQWSNRMQGPPLIYSIALKKAMQHFDAEHILEEKMKRDLTADERETLDGCKLLQSMLHDLDASLTKVRSLGAHEQDLYERIIPLIHDTFEGYDEETGHILQMFFKAYSMAVRYSIAKNTRELLEQGGDDGNGHKYTDIPEYEKLQDYALKCLVKEEAISKVIVGATNKEQVLDMARLCSKFDAELAEQQAETNDKDTTDG